MSKINDATVVNLEATHRAFPYQMQAFSELKDKDYCAIFHEQGLGKTKIAIDLILYWLTNRGIDTVLVVTKKQLVENWRNEFAFHTHIVPKILTTDRKSNFYVLNGLSRVVLTNFETVSAERERIALYLKCRDVAIVIDESTKLKNPESKLTKDFTALSALFKIRVIMTGTPVANRPYDIWSQIAAPFACLIITLFAIPAGIASGRQSVFKGILGALGLYFAFYGFTIGMMVVAKNGWFPAIPAALLPDALFLFFGIRAFLKQR